MKVLVFLGLLAVAALAISQSEKNKLDFLLKKKLIGGPNSLPYFLRPDYKKPEAQPATPETAQWGYGNVVEGVAKELKDYAMTPFRNAKNFIIKKFSSTPAAEISGIGGLPADFAWMAKELAVRPFRAAKKAIKEKFTKKPKVAPTPAPEPVQESGFAETLKSDYEKAKKLLKIEFGKMPKVVPPPSPKEFVNQVKAFNFTDHSNVIKKSFKGDYEKAKNLLQIELGLKKKIAPMPVQESAFGDNFNKAKNTVKGHFQRAGKWIKDKFAKKPEVQPATPETAHWGYGNVVEGVAKELKDYAMTPFRNAKNFIIKKFSSTPATETSSLISHTPDFVWIAKEIAMEPLRAAHKAIIAKLVPALY